MLGNYHTGRALWPLSVNLAADHNHVVQWPDDVKNRTLTNPVILVGYFPHSGTVPRSWCPPLRGLSPSYWAIRTIFRTGNPDPPMPFNISPKSLDMKEDMGDPTRYLSNWRATKEFRACLWLHNIKLERGNPLTTFSMTGWYHVGWTPPGAEDLKNRQGEYSQGIGGPRVELVEVQFEEWGASLQIDVGFRINELLPRIGSRLLFGNQVPFMRLTLDVVVAVNGEHRARCNGGYIPSQWYQYGWKDHQVDKYDMITGIENYSTIKRTLGAGLKGLVADRPNPRWRRIE